MDKPMVATTMGIMPYLKRGSTKPRLNNQPSTRTDTTTLMAKLADNAMPLCSMMTMMKAGNMTNSPWAKLMVPEACQSKVKPSAASA